MVKAIEQFINGATTSSTPAKNLIQMSGVNLAELTQYVRRMADFALNAAAEFQTRGDHIQALAQSDQATRYEHLEYVLTHEAVRKDNAVRLVAGLRNVRREVGRQESVGLHGKAEAKALLASIYGEPYGSELLDAISSGIGQGKNRQIEIRNFTLTVERGMAESFRYSLTVSDVHRGELKDVLTAAIKHVRDELSPDAPSQKHDGINPNEINNRVQESRTEGKAKSMAIAKRNSSGLAEGEQDLAAKTITLYRGENLPGSGKGVPDWIKERDDYRAVLEASGRWFTSDVAEAQKYANEAESEGQPARVVKIEIPETDIDKYRASTNPDVAKFVHHTKRDHLNDEFFVPRDIANTAIELHSNNGIAEGEHVLDTYTEEQRDRDKGRFNDVAGLEKRLSYDDLSPEEQKASDDQEREEFEASFDPAIAYQERQAELEDDPTWRGNYLRTGEPLSEAEVLAISEGETAKERADPATVLPETSRHESDGNNLNAILNRAQESRTEGKATSMATANVVPAVKATSSVKKVQTVSTPKVARPTKATARSKAAATEVELSGSNPVEATTQTVVAPATEVSATPQAIEAEVSQAPEQSQEPAVEKHWTKWRESPENLPATLEAQARVEYDKWAEKNADKAKEITFEKYRDFRIDQSAKNEARVRDEVEQVAATAGAPTDKSWRLQVGGFESLSDAHKDQVRSDLAKLIEKDPKKSSLDIAKYCADVQELCAKDKALAKAMLIDKTSVERGAVNLSNADHAYHFLNTIYKSERTGNDALGQLRTSVEPGSSKSITLKDAFTLTVERSGNNNVVRTSLQALPGKEAEVKRMFDDAASRAFRRAGIESPNKGRDQSRKSNDLGR